MKRIIIIIVTVMCLLSFQTKAQFGLQIGSDFSKIPGSSGVTGATEKYLTSFSGGLFYDKDIIPMLDIRVGVFYSPKGFHLSSNSDFIKSRINYLEIPVLAKVKIGPAYAMGGIYGAYGMNGKIKIETQGKATSDDFDFKDEDFRRFDFGLKFGVGVQLPFGPINTFAQCDYSIGLNNMNDGSGDKIKNHAIGISVGVLIVF